MLVDLSEREDERHPAALEEARRAVVDFVIEGVKTNLPFLTEVLDDDQFASGEYDTHLVDRLRS